MGMSRNVCGIVPPDEQWMKMKAVYDACMKADIDIPDEVDEYFDGRNPDDKGMQIDIDDAVEEYSGDSEDGFDVDLSKLPKKVKIIRFTNSW